MIKIINIIRIYKKKKMLPKLIIVVTIAAMVMMSIQATEHKKKTQELLIGRPDPSARKFVSKVIDDKIAEVNI